MAGGPYPGFITDVITHSCVPLNTRTQRLQLGKSKENSDIYSLSCVNTEAHINILISL